MRALLNARVLCRFCDAMAERDVGQGEMRTSCARRARQASWHRAASRASSCAAEARQADGAW
eukprot:4710031-Pleurochrysis_carterae.AAC.1